MLQFFEIQRTVVTPAKAGVYCVLLDFETGWNAMDTGHVSPTKIFNFCGARCRNDKKVVVACLILFTGLPRLRLAMTGVLLVPGGRLGYC